MKKWKKNQPKKLNNKMSFWTLVFLTIQIYKVKENNLDLYKLTMIMNYQSIGFKKPKSILTT